MHRAVAFPHLLFRQIYLEVSQRATRKLLLRAGLYTESLHTMAGVQDGQHGDLTSQILHTLHHKEPLLSAEAFPSIKSADVKSALDRLGSRSMVTYDTIEREVPVLEAEGQDITANGSHEARVFEALQKAMEGLTMAELEKAVGDKNTVKVGQMRAFKSKWITKGKEGRFVAAVRSTNS
jgi:phenylalanyl-tRNA synthetase alpha chain